jgi:hypothetical protein
MTVLVSARGLVTALRPTVLFLYLFTGASYPGGFGGSIADLLGCGQ